VENPTLATNPTSGENDFRDQNAEFESLSKELTEKELELSTLEKKLSLFEGKYASSMSIML
jgi:predicted  nucleic acid-binding Zn-ribbon protein